MTKAKKRLADHAQNAKLLEENKTREAQARELHRQSEILKSSRLDIVAEIDRLIAKRAELRKELQQAGNSIKTEEAKLQALPDAIQRLEEEKWTLAQQAYQVRKNTQVVPGSAKVDQEVIYQADQIRLRAMNANCSSLGLL